MTGEEKFVIFFAKKLKNCKNFYLPFSQKSQKRVGEGGNGGFFVFFWDFLVECGGLAEFNFARWRNFGKFFGCFAFSNRKFY